MALADHELDQMPDESSPLARLEQDCMALFAEYRQRREVLNNQPDDECLGCRVVRLERTDLFADAVLRVLDGQVRSAHKANRLSDRERARQAQLCLL